MVAYALKKNAVILYDAAYECFAQDGAARSIYEAEGAEKCAVEFCSFSKTAGFTGTRCGYTVVPSTLVVGGVSLKDMWYRRQSTKTNGVSYVVPKGRGGGFHRGGGKADREKSRFLPRKRAYHRGVYGKLRNFLYGW